MVIEHRFWRSHTDQLGFLNDIAGISNHCYVNHLALISYCTQTFGLRLAVERIDSAGAGNLLWSGRKDLVGNLDLIGMNSPLANHAQYLRTHTFAAIAVRVLEVQIRAIDSIDTGGTRGDNNLVARIMPEITRIDIQIVANILRVNPLRSAIITRAENQRLQPTAGTCDLLNVNHCLHLLDQHLQADGPRAMQA